MAENEDSQSSFLSNVSSTDHEEQDIADNDTDSVTSDESNYSNQEDSNDPWTVLVDRTFEKCGSEFAEEVNMLIDEGENEEEAREEAYSNMLPLFRKDIMGRYLERMVWYDEIKKDPVHRKIKSTVKRLIEEEDYDQIEALKYAVKKRKFLFDDILQSYDPPEVDNDTEDTEDIS